ERLVCALVALSSPLYRRPALTQEISPCGSFPLMRPDPRPLSVLAAALIGRASKYWKTGPSRRPSVTPPSCTALFLPPPWMVRATPTSRDILTLVSRPRPARSRRPALERSLPS